MSQLTAGQRTRLGLFVAIALVLLVGTLAMLVGSHLLEQRDEYFIVFNESISGLEPGSPVKYNGVRVGRVERYGINAENVDGVEVWVSLEHGTPIKRDTVAVLNSQGITGLKFIELAGGSNQTELVEPGETIASAESTLDLLEQKATQIATKLERLIDNLERFTGGENAERIESILVEVEGLAGGANRLLQDNSESIKQTLEHLADGSARLESLMTEAQTGINSLSKAAERASNWTNSEQVSRLATRLESTLRTAEQRLSKAEFGKTITEITRLADRSTIFVEHADLTLLRAKEDLLRALDELVTGAENFAEFASLLRDNPSALLGGGRKQERRLP